MTTGEFLMFYPQFGGVEEYVLNVYVEQANLRFFDCLDAAEEARRLYIAHKLTLYAQAYLPENSDVGSIASKGMAAQILSKSVGGVSISRSEISAVSGIRGYDELKQTTFGVQLIDLLKIATAGGKYIP